MQNIKKTYKNNYSKINANLMNDYAIALKNNDFFELIKKLKLNDKVGCKFTSKLETTCEELNNCSNCRGLPECKNKVNGYIYFPEKKDDTLLFSYIACKYQKKYINEKIQKNKNKYDLPIEIKKASFKNIDLSDRKRNKVIRWLKTFIDNYGKKENLKGLYLYGNFGCGKTYLIAATLNELKKKGVDSLLIYFSTLLRNLKEAMENNNFSIMMDDILNIDILVIDDIGAESLTNWGRDEILGSILQYRMDNKLITFFTSNLSLEDLESHLSETGYKTDVIKGRRIIERIKQLTEPIEMVSENRRK